MAQNPNQPKIEVLENRLKQAFSQHKFDEVGVVAGELRLIDPENHIARRLTEKIQEEAEAHRRQVHAEEINRLQDQVAQAFKKGQFDLMNRMSEELLKIDPKNSVVKKYKESLEKAESALKQAQLKKALPAKPSLFIRFKEWMKKRKAERISKALALKAKVAVKAPASAPATSPLAVAVPAVLNPPAAPVLPAKLPPAPLPPEASKPMAKEAAGNGNIFTKMFGNKEVVEPLPVNRSIMDTIIAKTEKEKHPPKIEKKQDFTGAGLARFAGAFFQFAVVFMFLTAGFFYVQNIDTENRVFELAGLGKNYASQLHGAAQKLETKKEEEQTLDREIKRYEGGYNNRYETTIRQIVETRLNWPDILKKINEITDTVYERNEISQYIQYGSFSFDAEKGEIRVSGTLTDPLGKNLTKLAELEEAFRNYPRDPSNPNDKTKPYFYSFNEFTALRKSFDKRSGRFTSSFQLSFSLEPEKEAAPSKKKR